MGGAGYFANMSRPWGLGGWEAEAHDGDFETNEVGRVCHNLGKAVGRYQIRYCLARVRLLGVREGMSRQLVAAQESSIKGSLLLKGNTELY